MNIPNEKTFLKAHAKFEKPTRDAVYNVSTSIIRQTWGSPSEMADALGVLLLVRNRTFYAYGSFSYEDLEKCISRNLEKLDGYRSRDIFCFVGG